MPDRPSFDLLFEHSQFVRGIALGLLRDEAAADDVAQSVWLTSLRSGPRDPSRLRAWLGRITRNLAIDRQRTERRRRSREERAARHERLPFPAEIVAREALRRRVVDAVLALDEPYRLTVLLRFFEELPPRVAQEPRQHDRGDLERGSRAPQGDGTEDVAGVGDQGARHVPVGVCLPRLGMEALDRMGHAFSPQAHQGSGSDGP